MGYYTSYILTIHEDGDRYVYIQDAIKEIIERIKYNPFIESCRWYEHENDIAWLSRQYPGTVFLLEGEGEDGVIDVWKKYFKDGLMQRVNAEVAFAPYDSSKLTNI